MKLNVYKLLVAMATAKMGNKDLQEATGLSKSIISRYMAGKADPAPKTIGRLAEALGCTVEYLTEED